MARTKPHINLVFIGHVDHGKSTTVGRLLFDTGYVDEQTMKKLKEKAAEKKKKAEGKTSDPEVRKARKRVKRAQRKLRSAKAYKTAGKKAAEAKPEEKASA